MWAGGGWGGEPSKFDMRGIVAIFIIQPHFLANNGFSMEMNLCHRDKTAYGMKKKKLQLFFKDTEPK